jgi:hypothetical protein
VLGLSCCSSAGSQKIQHTQMLCTRKNLSDIYLQLQLRIFIDVIISLSITTCFGPYGPSSGEYNSIVNNYILTFYIISNKLMNNGSVGIMMAFSKMF